VHKFFPELVNPLMIVAEQDDSPKENFCHAVELFLQKALHKEKPRGCQWIYMAPGSDCNVQKALVTKP
jgi:hypothetical protein